MSDENEYEPTHFYWHEAIDRSHLACDFFYEYVANHPAVLNDKELEEMAGEVADKIQAFYQAVSRKADEFASEGHQQSDIEEYGKDLVDLGEKFQNPETTPQELVQAARKVGLMVHFGITPNNPTVLF